MPPSNTPNATAQPNGHVRKRTAPVVPAIPLALSKPKSARPQPKPERHARADAAKVIPSALPSELDQVAVDLQPASNGDEQQVTHGNTIATAQDHDDGSLEPGTPSNGTGPVTNGAPTEDTDNKPNGTSTPSALGDAAVTDSFDLARKPTERFDMRQIRTELPPAFIPSAESHTPRSNTSSQSTRPPGMPPLPHASHPSTSSIVFGGHESSSSSPAPPQSAGSAYNPPSLPNFGGAAPAFHPSSHAHHTSDPHGPRFPQQSFQQPVSPWNARPGYGPSSQPIPPHHSHAHMPFRIPPRETYTPVESPYANGNLSRPASQASSAAAEQSRPAQPLQSPLGLDPAQESRSAFPPHHGRQFHQQMPPPPPPQMQPADVVSQLDNADALRLHVLSQFANPDSSDCSVTFAEDHDGARQPFAGHRLVLSRSPTLANILSSHQALFSTGIPEVEVTLTGRYLKLATMNEALRYLYGGPLLQIDHHRPGSSASERTSVNTEKMENALSYIAAGSWLKVPAIGGRGVDVAGSLLHWDTIPAALAFALDGGLSQVWTIDDGSEDPFSAASSDDSLGRSEITGAPSYDPYSTTLLQRIVDFTIHVCPPNFYLDSSAPQLESCPRLPPLPRAPSHESRPSASDPRLSQIRFGEVPIGPSFTTTMISSVLLSLPFQLLKGVLEHFIFTSRLGQDTTTSIMRQVVTEREKRRRRAQQARTAGTISSRADPQLLQNLYWEESVDSAPHLKAGLRLARRRTGIDTPLSSGPE